MKTRLLLTCILVLSITSCKDDANKNGTKTTKTEEIVDESSSLKLNNGEKWIANFETHDGIAKMDAIIKVFKSDTTKDYASLGEALSEQTSMIIKKCSMKGEPHNQLHVVLVPMLDEISVFKEPEVNVNMERALYKLDSLTATYFKYFKTQ